MDHGRAPTLDQMTKLELLGAQWGVAQMDKYFWQHQASWVGLRNEPGAKKDIASFKGDG